MVHTVRPRRTLNVFYLSCRSACCGMLGELAATLSVVPVLCARLKLIGYTKLSAALTTRLHTLKEY
eukprot:10087-Heterococcus_DN1.PRE.3